MRICVACLSPVTIAAHSSVLANRASPWSACTFQGQPARSKVAHCPEACPAWRCTCRAPCGHQSPAPLQGRWPGSKAQGELHLQLVYKAFEEDEADVGYREAEAFAGLSNGKVITDVKSAAGAPL